MPHGDYKKVSGRRRTILKEERTSEKKLDRNQKKRMIKTNGMECLAVWITDIGYEKRRYKKIGGHRNVNMEKN